MDSVHVRLEYLRGEIRAERISYGEIAELQGLADKIDPDDVELLEWAGVPEHPDLQFVSHGSVVLLSTGTDEGAAWVEENVGAESWQWLGDSIACEPRMVGAVIEGALDGGLTVSLDGRAVIAIEPV
jgi:hypothetical protein